MAVTYATDQWQWQAPPTDKHLPAAVKINIKTAGLLRILYPIIIQHSTVPVPQVGFKFFFFFFNLI